MSEVLTGIKWVVATLTGDATLAAMAKVYSDMAPPGAAFPYIIVASTSPRDYNTFNATRVLVSDVVMVKAVALGRSYDPLEPIVDRIDLLLHRKAGPVAGGGSVVSCAGLEPIMYPEFDEVAGTPYRHLGRSYEINIQ